MHISEFTDIGAMKKIKQALYVMKPKNQSRVFRAGIVGLAGKDNNAIKRIQQCNNSRVFREKKWNFEYVYIYDFTEKFGEIDRSQLIRCEVLFQSKIYRSFDYDGNSMFLACDSQDVIETAKSSAQEAVKNVLGALPASHNGQSDQP